MPTVDQIVLTDRDIGVYKDAAALAPHDPWTFVKYFFYTKDEHDPSFLYKPFPVKACYRVLTRAFTEFDVMFMEKARQVMISWIYCALYLHDAMFQYNRRIFFQSEKEPKSEALIERVRNIFVGCEQMTYPIVGSWLPEPKRTGKKVGTDSQIEFVEMGSSITSIPQGPDQIPSYTVSGLFADEIDLQPKFEKGYGAAAPAIHGGGRFTGTGSVYGHTYGEAVIHGLDPHTRKSQGEHKIDSRKVRSRFLRPPGHLNDVQARYWLEDQLVNMPSEDFNSVPFHELVACVPGIDYHRTVKDVDCLRFHYTADPLKDPVTEEGKVWEKGMRKIFITTRAWDQHMEMSRDVHEGRPVVGNWSRSRFVKDLSNHYDSNIPLGLSFDFGTQVCGCLFSQYLPVIINGRTYHVLKILAELIIRNSNTPYLAKATVKLLERQFSRSWDTNNIDACCDPNGGRQNETTSDQSMNTSIKILEAEGIRPSSRKFGCCESTELIETVFAVTLPDENESPIILIDESCTYLIKCLGGGLHYPPFGKGKQGHYEKDGEHDHGGDMVRYRIANDFTEYALTGLDEPLHHQAPRIIDPSTGRMLGYKDTAPQGVGEFPHRYAGGL